MAKRYGVHCIKSDGTAFSLEFDEDTDAMGYVEQAQEVAPELKFSIVDRKSGELTFFERKVELAGASEAPSE